VPYSGDVRQDIRADKLEVAFSDAAILHIKTTIDIYGRSEEDIPKLTESRQDLDLLLDPVEEIRVIRTAENAEQFDHLAESARLVHIPITCHEAQVDPILSDAKIVGMLAGNRAGKTEVLAARLLRAWIKRGGKGRVFWWVAPQRSQTQIAVEKLCLFRGANLPLLPPELWTHYPTNERSGDQSIRLIDGSKIELHHASGNGDNLKGKLVQEAVIDELCSIRDVKNWNTIIARTMEVDGTVAAASTPVRGHWARAMIITAAGNSEDTRSYQFSCFENPWAKRAYIERSILAAGGHDDPVVRRDYYGEWSASDDALWPDYSPEMHLVQDAAIEDVAELIKAGHLPATYRDLTARMVVGGWKGHTDATVVIGQDFNVNPMTGVICRIFGDPLVPDTWGLYIFDEVQVRGPVARYADRLSDLYPGAPISCDATGAQVGNHASQLAGSSAETSVKILREAGFDAVACNRRRVSDHKVKASNPSQIDSLNLCHRLFRQGRILVNKRCKALCLALDTQEAQADGRVAKDPGTASDRLSAPTDAMRYLIWKLFSKELRKLGKGKKKEALTA